MCPASLAFDIFSIGAVLPNKVVNSLLEAAGASTTLDNQVGVRDGNVAQVLIVIKPVARQFATLRGLYCLCLDEFHHSLLSSFVVSLVSPARFAGNRAAGARFRVLVVIEPLSHGPLAGIKATLKLWHKAIGYDPVIVRLAAMGTGTEVFNPGSLLTIERRSLHSLGSIECFRAAIALYSRSNMDWKHNSLLSLGTRPPAGRGVD